MTVNRQAMIQVTRAERCRVHEYSEEIRRYRNNRPDLFTIAGQDMTRTEYVGRVGEYALAKFLGVEYPFHITGDLDGDVAGYQVRTRSRHYYELPTYDRDEPGIYVLATFEPDAGNGLVILHGWTDLAATTVPERWATHLPFPCYLTPHRDLHPMTTLRSRHD
jgi:hypothetical protein